MVNGSNQYVFRNDKVVTAEQLLSSDDCNELIEQETNSSVVEDSESIASDVSNAN